MYCVVRRVAANTPSQRLQIVIRSSSSAADTNQAAATKDTPSFRKSLLFLSGTCRDFNEETGLLDARFYRG